MHTDCWVTHTPESSQELTVDVTLHSKSNIYPCAVMNHDTIKCPALKRTIQTHTTCQKM